VRAASAALWRAYRLPGPLDCSRAVVSSLLLGAQVEAAFAGGDPVALTAVLDMRDKESRRLASLATMLRLTNQSRYTPQSAATAAKRGGGGKVWQFGKTGG